MPFYLLVRAHAAWTPAPRFFPDDALYARMCLPSGLLVYWHDFGLYRLLPVLFYALLNRSVMRAHVSPALLCLTVLALATGMFVWSCLRAGLSRRRGALLAGVLLGSPLLLETINFWSGTLNYALVLLLLALQLRAVMWASRRARSRRGLFVTAGGALLALLTYEIALPFILATSACYVRGQARRIVAVGLTCLALIAFVAVLAAAGLYWPTRFTLLADPFRLTSTQVTATTTGDFGHVVPLTMRARVWMYALLALDFLRTGFLTFGFWGVVACVAGLMFSREREAGGRRELPPGARSNEAAKVASGEFEVRSVESLENGAELQRRGAHLLSQCFAFALVACVVYLFVTGAANARYVAFLLIYGAATVAWMPRRAATYALAAVLLVQAAVAAALPLHLRGVALAAQGQATAQARGTGDLVSINGRLARAAWEKRFRTTQTGDVLTEPLGARTCRYAVPCEPCR